MIGVARGGEHVPAGNEGIVVGGVVDVPVPRIPHVVRAVAADCLLARHDVLAGEPKPPGRAVESEHQGRVVVGRTVHERHEEMVA